MKKAIILIVFITISCVKTEKKTHYDSSVGNKNYVHIELISPPVNWLYKDEFGGTYHSGKYEISYLDDNLIPRYWMPNHSKGKDTLIIKTKRDFVDINHKYEGDDYYSFTFTKGDSVQIRYDSLKRPSPLIINKKTPDRIDELSKIASTDSIFIKYYRDELLRDVRYDYLKNVPLIEVSQGKKRDYRVVFDSISINRNFLFNEKKFLLLYYLEKMTKEHYSVKDINDYFKKFNFIAKDTVISSYFTRKYNVNGSISKQLALKDFKKNNIDFGKLLESLKGKVVYVDFWASWCVPCRRAFPASKELREKYIEEDLVFLYLAVYDTEKDWIVASEDEKLDDYSYNYYVTNSLSSELMTQLKIKAIPRYLIYNKKGELVHKNAPGPNTSEIKELLDNYISQK